MAKGKLCLKFKKRKKESQRGGLELLTLVTLAQHQPKIVTEQRAWFLSGIWRRVIWL